MQLIARPAPPDEPEKATQKAIPKRTVDYCGPYVKLLQERLLARTPWEARAMQPTMAAALDLLPPEGYPHAPASSLAVKFVHNSQNRVRCAVNVAAWQPDARRCITGAQTGEISLWRGSDHQFESVLQAHEAPLRCMVYTHNGSYLLSGDDAGTLKIFKRNFQPLRELPAHRESLRAVSVGPTDLKFCTCSDDSTIKVWDMYSCEVESTLTGHGGDVRHCEWHPTSSLLASASKDALVKLWDARTAGEALATLHGHKGAVMQARWNPNGNWLLSVSRDQTLKVWDLRTLRELRTLQGHSRDALCADWHPIHEEVLVSGHFDGTLCHWLAGRSEPQAIVGAAHEGSVWGLAWHPLGHELASVGGDAAVKFWCRARPGDPWEDARLKDQQEGATSYAGAGGDAPGLRSSAMGGGFGGGGGAPAAIPGLSALGDASMPLPAAVTAAGRAPPPGLSGARPLPGPGPRAPPGGPARGGGAAPPPAAAAAAAARAGGPPPGLSGPAPGAAGERRDLKRPRAEGPMPPMGPGRGPPPQRPPGAQGPPYGEQWPPPHGGRGPPQQQQQAPPPRMGAGPPGGFGPPPGYGPPPPGAGQQQPPPRLGGGIGGGGGYGPPPPQQHAPPPRIGAPGGFAPPQGPPGQYPQQYPQQQQQPAYPPAPQHPQPYGAPPGPGFPPGGPPPPHQGWPQPQHPPPFGAPPPFGGPPPPHAGGRGGGGDGGWGGGRDGGGGMGRGRGRRR
ncbi:hypothetical protein Rsub_07690 [Raphidocelis subcapitata]|uniref:Uncharacterized protein n=1 Tax=Raphidocelis subcapitata TaxID=307507 RepID=A0A2V0P5I2_9CHLO|nr:hypothetical protein Rsub_07690 [Raphidocelis subcapitata]|eukprot:GBF95106.1 hypothetical protein Rsub_07690 [Raphidocelis subcapitata]